MHGLTCTICVYLFRQPFHNKAVCTYKHSNSPCPPRGPRWALSLHCLIRSNHTVLFNCVTSPPSLVTPPHPAVRNRLANGQQSVCTYKHSNSPRPPRGPCWALSIHCLIRSYHDGQSAIPSCGFHPVDSIEQTCCGSIACIHIVHPLPKDTYCQAHIMQTTYCIQLTAFKRPAVASYCPPPAHVLPVVSSICNCKDVPSPDDSIEPCPIACIDIVYSLQSINQVSRLAYAK